MTVIRAKTNAWHIPSSTRTTSTTALCGISTWCVHMQLAPQSAGLLSPLQNCSGGMSSICESGGAGGNVNEISSTREITWSPVGATANTPKSYDESHAMNFQAGSKIAIYFAHKSRNRFTMEIRLQIDEQRYRIQRLFWNIFYMCFDTTQTPTCVFYILS